MFSKLSAFLFTVIAFVLSFFIKDHDIFILSLVVVNSATIVYFGILYLCEVINGVEQKK